LLPLPGFVAKLVQKAQQEQLKKKDARVQTVTESWCYPISAPRACVDCPPFSLLVMQVIRMIKLFGWEKKMEENVYEKREEELVWIKKRQIIEVLSAIVKCVSFFMSSMSRSHNWLTYEVLPSPH
jgi:hypothetical protein